MNYSNKPKTFKPYPDGGSLKSTGSKKTPVSPDYWGDIAINLKDMTNVRVEDGLTIIKLSGWKKLDSTGKTYLSLAVNRFVPENTAPAPKQSDDSGFDEMSSDF
jgi:hypothetical protein